MASKNQQFTSGLKQPSSFTKRKGPEISAATGVSKRPRDGSDGNIYLTDLIMQSLNFMIYLLRATSSGSIKVIQ